MTINKLYLMEGTAVDIIQKPARPCRKIENKGSGAGGANTNKNGLLYESQKDLKTEYDILEEYGNYRKVSFKGYPGKVFVTGRKSQFMKYLLNNENREVPRCHGTKEPDCWFISQNSNVFKSFFIFAKVCDCKTKE